jgi:hypothetical protein
MAADDTLLNTRQLLQELGQLCTLKKTGTALIATQDNQLIRIVMDAGRIVSLAVGSKSGPDAIALVRAVKAGRLRFSEGGATAAREAEALPPTDKLLQMLGGGVSAPAPAVGSVSAALLTRIEDALIEHLGPMGSLIWREQLDAAPDARTPPGVARAIEAAAKQIGDPGKIQRFRELALKLLKGG